MYIYELARAREVASKNRKSIDLRLIDARISVSVTKCTRALVFLFTTFIILLLKLNLVSIPVRNRKQFIRTERSLFWCSFDHGPEMRQAFRFVYKPLQYATNARWDTTRRTFLVNGPRKQLIREEHNVTLRIWGVVLSCEQDVTCYRGPTGRRTVHQVWDTMIYNYVDLWPFFVWLRRTLIIRSFVLVVGSTFFTIRVLI